MLHESLALVVVALISVGGVVFTEVNRRRTRVELDALQARRQEEKTRDQYLRPLLHAAYQLQSRIWNMWNPEERFLHWAADQRDHSVTEYAETNTLHVMAEYFGWQEIIRREIQFLNKGNAGESTRLASDLEDIVETFLTSDLGRFMVFRGEQRAIGELMIQAGSDGRSSCMGYGAFHKALKDENVSRWFTRLRRDLADTQSDDPSRAHSHLARLGHVQKKLVDLIKTHDHDNMLPRNLGTIEVPPVRGEPAGSNVVVA